MKKISKIESTRPVFQRRLKVAAYCRVSVDTEQLMHSLSAQVSYYSALIQKNPEWEYAGVYADAGISGTSMEARDQFTALIADCDAGKINIVLTKSISRFARDTVDCLNVVRHLKSIGVEVRFERERINTLSCDGELLLTILASYAQEEAESLSRNIKWAIKKKYEKGERHIMSRAYGYRWDGEQMVIDPGEAQIVQYIFESYRDGMSPNAIAKELRGQGIRGKTGSLMSGETVTDMLKNDVYVGDMTLQKSCMAEIGKKVRNRGQLPKYVVEDEHEAIISRELFEAVAKVRAQRSRKPYEKTCFSGKVKCGKCGAGCSRRSIPHSKKTPRKIYKRWSCNAWETMQICDLKRLPEDELREAAAFAIGSEYLDEDLFRRKVEQIFLFDDRIVFQMTTGGERVWQRR